MNIDLEQLKTLVEAGDKAALETHIYKALEKGDVSKAAAENTVLVSELDSLKDTHHTKALETWKSNHLQGLIDDAVKKANPTETPEQKRIRELEEKIELTEKANQKEKLMNVALGVAAESKLPKGILDKLLGEDEASTLANIKSFSDEYQASVKAALDEKYKQNGRDPGTGGSGGAADFGEILAKEFGGQPQEHIEARDNYFK